MSVIGPVRVQSRYREAVAGDDKFMRCGNGKRKERIKFIKKNSKKKFGEGGKRRRTRDTENRYF